MDRWQKAEIGKLATTRRGFFGLVGTGAAVGVGAKVAPKAPKTAEPVAYNLMAPKDIEVLLLDCNGEELWFPYHQRRYLSASPFKPQKEGLIWREVEPGHTITGLRFIDLKGTYSHVWGDIPVGWPLEKIWERPVVTTGGDIRVDWGGRAPIELS